MTSRRFVRPASLLACCLVLVTLVSCGKSGPKRYELSGTVTYQGKAVPAGSIRFEPLGKTVNNTTIGDAEIKDGKFSTLLNRGIIGGMHRVFVYGFNGIPEPGSGPYGAQVFSQYIVDLDLPEAASTLDVVVPDSVQALRPF